MFGAGNRARTGDLYLGKVSLYQLSYSREYFQSSLPWRGYRSPGTRLVGLSILTVAGELSMTMAYSIASGSLSLGQALIRYWNMDHRVNTAAIYNSTIPVWYTGINSILSRNMRRISASIWAMVLTLP